MLDFGLDKSSLLRFDIAVPVLATTIDYSTVYTLQHIPETTMPIVVVVVVFYRLT